MPGRFPKKAARYLRDLAHFQQIRRRVPQLEQAQTDLQARVAILERQLKDQQTHSANLEHLLEAQQSQSATLTDELQKANQDRRQLAMELQNAWEAYQIAQTGASGNGVEAGWSDRRLIESLQAAGVPAARDDRILLHVGFGHAATTSLQHNFFSQRDDLFYVGTPYAEAGGFFSHLKYLGDWEMNFPELLSLCRDTVYGNPRREGRPIVISDETFTDASEVYFVPRHIPGDLLAARLKRFFPTAKVVFTIRNQLEYVLSLYFNLKRNYAFLAGAPIPPFEEWWEGMKSQVRCLYLANLDYSSLIGVYEKLFGRDNILILPLEQLKASGAEPYLQRLCSFFSAPLGQKDIERFRQARNTRMTVAQERLADLLANRPSDAWARQVMHDEGVASLMADATPATLKLDEAIANEIRQRVIPGNRRLAETFGLPLGELGYPE